MLRGNMLGKKKLRLADGLQCIIDFVIAVDSNKTFLLSTRYHHYRRRQLEVEVVSWLALILSL
jgi:hypothetical protein